MSKKVSVIIPVYNEEQYLAQCLSSVLCQTLREIEIICVDDGSTDGSLKILESFAADDERVAILQQENQYAGCARNLGMEKARGRYLVFWDSDDYFEETALEKMYAACERDGAEICVTHAKVLDETSGKIYTGKYLSDVFVPEDTPFSRADIPQYIFNFGSNNPWNKMFRRAFVEEHALRFQPLRQTNDAYFVMMALFYARRITCVRDWLMI